MKNYSIDELLQIKEEITRKNKKNQKILEKINKLINYKLIKEDGEAMANASGMGMGNVGGASPSGNIGCTIGSNYSAGGGTIGSGDISVPYNTGSNKMVFTKGKGYEHGSIRKKRKKNNIREIMRNAPEKPSRVLSFNDYQKSNVNQVHKVKDFKK